MSGFSNPIIGGGGALVYPSIHSPNYITGISGWTINKDGSAEFDNLTIRGVFNGTDFILSNAGLFFYGSTPAAGNLIGAWTSGPGADQFGNGYEGPGIMIGGNTAPQAFLATTTGSGAQGAALEFLMNTADVALVPLLVGEVENAGAANQFLQLLLQGPAGTGGNQNQFSIELSSDSDDGTIPAAFVIFDSYGFLYLAMQNTNANGPTMQVGGFASPLPVTLNGALLTYGAGSGGQFTKTYTSPVGSSFNIPIPAGVATAHVECLGPGAGGQYASGPGGGSGSYGGEPALAVTSAGITAFIGKGGVAGTPGSHAGGAGSAATTATGTSVTVTGNAAPINNSTGTPSSSSGGPAPGNTVARAGSGSSGWNAAAQGGGGGAGAPSASAAGGAGAGPANTQPGSGGSSGAGSLGGNGAGGGWGSAVSNGDTTGGGNGGTGAGGGAGGSGPAAGSGATGGKGGSGAIRVTYTYPGTVTIVASQSTTAGTDINGLAYPEGFGGVNIPIVTQTPATQAFTLASAVLITGLSVALVPGTYAVEINIPWTQSGTVGGTHQHYVAFSGTVSASAWNTLIWQTQAANAVTQTLAFATGTAFPIASQGSPTHVAENGWTTVTGRIVVTGAGTLAAGIVLSAAGDGITTEIGSMMTVTRTA